MPFTEFCCRSGGSNLNAGTRTGNSTEPGTSPNFTYASGSWVASTGVFTVASGNPSTDGVAVGDMASVYADGSTVTNFIGRVTAVSSTTITVSTTIKAGTAPTDGTSNRTLRIGGAWAGPSGSSGFPFNVLQNTLVASAGDFPRVNLKNDQTYSVSAAITHSQAGITFFGYSTTYGDGGRSTISGGTSGASYVLLTLSGTDCWLQDLIFLNNGATGSALMISVSGSRNLLRRCVFAGSRGVGVNGNAVDTTYEECESYSHVGDGFSQSATAIFRRCISHDNSGDGFENAGANSLIAFENCIADTNTGVGFLTTGVNTVFSACDAYNNGSHGFNIAGTSNRLWTVVVENCNAVKNGGWGIAQSSNRRGTILNCAVGAGTQANTSGGIQTGYIDAAGTVTYASNVTPWVDPAAGDFRINLAAARAAGRGSFLQTQAGYSGTIGYPDIGAAQSQASGGSGGLFLPRPMNGGYSA